MLNRTTTLILLAALLGCGAFMLLRRFPAAFGRTAALERDNTQLRVNHGRYFQSGQTNPFTGLMVERYHGGALKARSAISNGMLYGLSEGWHTNGQIEVREYFQEGVAHGVRTKWFETGQRLSEVSIVQGKLQGVFRRWHDNGQLAQEIQMDQGEAHGLSRAYYRDGSQQAEVMMQRGQPQTQRYWTQGERAAGLTASLPSP